MGLPLTAYGALDHLLHTAGRGEEDRVWSAFKAVAFILHDPVWHRDVSEALRGAYDRLHQETGTDLLFVPLVAHPHDTRDHGYAEPSPDALRDLAPHIGAPAHGGGTTLDAFAATLGIPRTAFPVVVLSTDVLRPEFVWMPVDGDRIVPSIEAATEGARAADRSLEALHELLPGTRWARVPRGRRGPGRRGPGLASALADVLSLLELHGIDGDPNTRRQARRRGARVVRGILRRVRDEKRRAARLTGRSGGAHRRLDGERAPDLADAAALLALAARPRQVPPARQAAWESTLDPTSQSFLRTARLTHVALQTGLSALGHDARRDDRLFDFSMVVGPFGKAVEREMNTGWMEWVRWTLGAEMPTHFGRRARGLRLRVEPTRPGWSPIDLNRPDRAENPDRWRALTLAEAEQVMETRIAAGRGPDGLDPARWAHLAEALAPVRDLRNLAFHIDPLGPDAADEMFALVDRLGALDAFASMDRARRAVATAQGPWPG